MVSPFKPVYPVDKQIPVSQGFWWRHPEDPRYEDIYRVFGGHHPGLDFSMPEGGEIFASFEGIVVRREFHKGMGWTLGVRNGNIVAIYAHLKEFNAELGQIVRVGEVIAISGNTGDTTRPDNPHLHFEFRDITKPTLPEMVFEPEIDEPVDAWQEKFTYTINNTNTKKTLGFLALRYFGTEDRWEVIKQTNEGLSTYDKEDMLPDDLVIQIPNF